MRTITIVSILIPVAVALLMIMPASWKAAMGIEENSQLSSLPLFHAVLNGSTFVLLVFAGIAIKSKKISIHRTFMLSAFVLSSVFLISYVIYHMTHESARFGGEGAIRTVYFIVLISHIILSVPVIPLALSASTVDGRITLTAIRKGKIRLPGVVVCRFNGCHVYLFMQPYY